MGDQVERGEFLEDPHRIGGAENGDGAGEANVFGTRCSRSQDHGWGGIQELGAVMFADAENVKANLIGEFDLLQQMLHSLDGAKREPGGRIRDGCGEAVDTDLQHAGSWYPVLYWMLLLNFCCMFVTGMWRCRPTSATKKAGPSSATAPARNLTLRAIQISTPPRRKPRQVRWQRRITP